MKYLIILIDVSNIIIGNTADKNMKDKDKRTSIFELEINNKAKKTKTSLFPYRYYLCSIFIKRLDVSKKSMLFSQKFKIIYNFLSQLLDISFYIILEKEFEIMKNILLVDKYKDKSDNNKKINANDICLNAIRRDYLTMQKFAILDNEEDQ